MGTVARPIKSVGTRPGKFGDSVVQFLGGSQSLGRVQVIIGQVRSNGQDVNIYPLLVHEDRAFFRSKLPFLVDGTRDPVHGVDVLNAVPGEEAGAVPIAVLLIGIPKAGRHDVTVYIDYFHKIAPFAKGYSIPFANSFSNQMVVFGRVAN